MRVLVSALGAFLLGATALHDSRPAAAEPPTGWAVLFAPAEYAGVPRQVHQTAAVKRVADRLIKSGWPAEQVRVLEGGSATIERLREEVERVADTMPKDRTLLVVLATRATADDDLAIWGADSGRAADVRWPLRSLVETMATAPTSRRILVADFTLAGTGEPRPNPDYSSYPLAIAPGQFVVINAAESIDTARKGEDVATPFMKALVDALDGYAVEPGQAEVGLFQTLEYLRHFMLAKSLLPPVIQGSVNGDFAIVSVDAGAGPIVPEEQAADRRVLAATLLEAAERAFVVERDLEGATVLLDRARRHADADLSDPIERLADSVLAFKGGPVNVKAAVERARGRGESLLLRLDKEAAQVVYVEGKPTTRRLASGTWIKVEQERNGWLWATSAHSGSMKNGKVEFTPISLAQGWVGLDAFPPRTSSGASERVERLRRVFSSN